MPEPRPGPMPHTDEWYTLHRTIITATDIAAILGLSEYKTALDVFLEKTYRLPPFKGNEHTRRGTRYEPVILADYAEQEGQELLAPQPLYYHPTIDFLGATPDARRKSDGNLVEAKFTMSRTRAEQLGEEKTDMIPDDWLFQGQTQMLVMDCQEVDFAVLLYGRLKVYTVRRSNALSELILDAARDMQRRILADDAPEPNWTNPHTPELIKAMHGLDDGKSVLLDADTESLWNQSQELAQEIKAMEESREMIRAKILHRLGDAGVGILPDATRYLARTRVNRKEYTVAATSYIQLRQYKTKK